jgi:hypothetical protein
MQTQLYTDKKENQIFLICMYKKIQKYQLLSHKWLVMASSCMVKYLRIFSYIRKPFLIYDFATDPIWISLYMRKISFSFLSVTNSLFCECSDLDPNFHVNADPDPDWHQNDADPYKDITPKLHMLEIRNVFFVIALLVYNVLSFSSVSNMLLF